MDKQEKKIADKEHRKADIKAERCFFWWENIQKLYAVLQDKLLWIISVSEIHLCICLYV